jgi:hypothetical protein
LPINGDSAGLLGGFNAPLSRCSTRRLAGFGVAGRVNSGLISVLCYAQGRCPRDPGTLRDGALGQGPQDPLRTPGRCQSFLGGPQDGAPRTVPEFSPRDGAQGRWDGARDGARVFTVRTRDGARVFWESEGPGTRGTVPRGTVPEFSGSRVFRESARDGANQGRCQSFLGIRGTRTRGTVRDPPEGRCQSFQGARDGANQGRCQSFLGRVF